MSTSPDVNPAFDPTTQGDAHGQASGASEATPRLVVVEGAAWAERLTDLTQSLGMSCVRVPSYLSALGELSTHPADVLIGPGDVWRGSLHTVVNAAIALCTGIRLIAVCDSDDLEHQASAKAAGFNGLLTPPFKKATLQAVLGLPVQEAEGRQEVTAPQEDRAPDAPHHEADGTPAEEVGDIDLIDAILNGASAFNELACRMIASHSGITGLGIRPADGAAPEGCASVPVLYRGVNLALLFADPPTTEEDLSAWAEWLSRWLAMRQQFGDLHDQALKDELTGVWNRRYFNRFLNRILKRAQEDRSQVTLLVFDIDDFKLYNDAHGHGTGDMVLREAARLMGSVVREHDVVARIGGDEFAVIFWDNEGPRKPNSQHPHDVVAMARRFQDAICAHRFPKLLEQAIGRLTVSGGLACYPWDGRTASELLTRADAMALQSKRQGKNAITFGTGSKRSDC